MSDRTVRRHSPEFRREIAERMVAGENAFALSRQYGLARSMMYRWRQAYLQSGAAGLEGKQGRPKQGAQTRPLKAKASTTEEKLRGRIAELERKIGQQECAIDFFKGVFKRLEDLPKAKKSGGKAFTPRSGE